MRPDGEAYRAEAPAGSLVSEAAGRRSGFALVPSSERSARPECGDPVAEGLEGLDQGHGLEIDDGFAEGYDHHPTRRRSTVRKRRASPTICTRFSLGPVSWHASAHGG
jgi:hypothetical protein